jgi:hypothetical protein
VTVEALPGGVALLTLNNPAKLNALSVEMGRAFQACMLFMSMLFMSTVGQLRDGPRFPGMH